MDLLILKIFTYCTKDFVNYGMFFKILDFFILFNHKKLSSKKAVMVK